MITGGKENVIKASGIRGSTRGTLIISHNTILSNTHYSFLWYTIFSYNAINPK